MVARTTGNEGAGILVSEKAVYTAIPATAANRHQDRSGAPDP